MKNESESAIILPDADINVKPQILKKGEKTKLDKMSKELVVAKRTTEMEIMPKGTKDLEDSKTLTAESNENSGLISRLISDNLPRWKEEHKRIDEEYEKKMTVIESEIKDPCEKVRMMEQAAQDRRKAHLKTRATHFGEIVASVGGAVGTAIILYKLAQKYPGISFAL